MKVYTTSDTSFVERAKILSDLTYDVNMGRTIVVLDDDRDDDELRGIFDPWGGRKV